MIGQTILVNEKTYTIKRELKFGEFAKMTELNNSLVELTKKYGDEEDFDKLSRDEMQKVTLEFSQKGTEQIKLMVTFLNEVIGLNQESLNDLPLSEAMLVFTRTFKAATEIKKNLDEPSV